MKRKTKWLDRRIARPGPYLALCLSQEEYEAAMGELNCKEIVSFVNPGADATTHHLNNDKRELVCVVCLKNYEAHSPIEVAGLLIHEAVHVWQEYASVIGERNPGGEQEAHAVQSISQELMQAFADRL